MAGEDFVMVQLSKRGEEIAGGAPIGVGGATYHFEFKPGEPQRVLKSEFERILSKEVRVNEKEEAECLFELAPKRTAGSRQPSVVGQVEESK